MNVKKHIKRIGALLAGASMVGATIMGAMADLSAYPAPFVQNGVVNTLIVVGANAKTTDTLGAIDIAASIQAVATLPADITGTTEGKKVVFGDAVEIGKSSDLLEMNENIGDVRPVLTENDLDALSGGTLRAKTTTTYKQYLRFDDAGADLVAGSVVYEQNDDDKVGDFLKFNDGDVMFEYHLEFQGGLESDLDGTTLEDIEDLSLNLFGTEFVITTPTISTTTDTISLTLLGGAVTDTLGEGETKTYTIDGVDYEVTVLFISDQDPESVKFSVNGDVSKELNEADTDEVADGVDIGVRDILTNQREGIVEFYLGADKVVMTDSDTSDGAFDNSSDALTAGEETIGAAEVNIKVTNVSSTVKEINYIKYRLEADASTAGDIYIAPGHGLREYLDEPEGMLNPNWDIRYEGLMDTGETLIEIDASGDDEYFLKWTNNNGVEFRTKFVNDEGTFKTGDDDQDLLWFECTNATNETVTWVVDRKDFVLLTDDPADKNAISYVVEFTDYDTDDNTLEFSDGDDTYTVTYAGTVTTKGSASGALNLGGKEWTIYPYYDGTNMKLCVDNDGDGSVNAGEYAKLVTFGGAVIDLCANCTTAEPTDDFNMSLTTEQSQFDDSSGGDEVWYIMIDNGASQVDLSVPDNAGVGLDMTQDEDDDEHSYGTTNYGILIDHYTPDGANEADELTLHYPLAQRGCQVFVTAGTVTTTTTGGVGGAVTVNPAAVGIGVLDSEVSLGQGNLIVVGGPCVNTIAADLMGNPTVCTEGFEAGKAVIKLFSAKNALLVAGYSAQDTLGAAYVLSDYEDYDLSGTEVEVVVADLDSITVNRVG